VLYEIIVAMTKLMAPVLSFTAEEIWRSLATQMTGTPDATSVHLSQFPDACLDWQDAALAQRWDKLLKYREQVQGVLEVSRRDKVIGSSLEAAVELRAVGDDLAFLKSYERDLPTVFIVSQVKIVEGGDAQTPVSVVASKSSFAKCERCWNYREAVGKDPTHPTLCDRCVEAVQ